MAAAGIGVAVIAMAAVAQAVKGAARTLGSAVVIAAALTAGIIIGAVAVIVVVRLQGRRGGAPPAPVQLFHPNPQASPLPRREARAIAPPQVVVNIDAGLLAGLLREAQQPTVRVIPASAEEVRR